MRPAATDNHNYHDFVNHNINFDNHYIICHLNGYYSLLTSNNNFNINYPIDDYDHDDNGDNNDNDINPNNLNNHYNHNNPSNHRNHNNRNWC